MATAQRLVTAYAIKYHSSGGQWQPLYVPMHTLPAKARMGLVQTEQVSIGGLTAKQREGARKCAALLHAFLPQHFPVLADAVLVGEWVLVDITLRMLKPRELYLAQGFLSEYIIDEVPDPAILFKGNEQVANPLDVPRIKLIAEEHVRMCGNSVSPLQAAALVRANCLHEQFIPVSQSAPACRNWAP